MDYLGHDFGETLGCMLIGLIFALILYGCTCAQVLYYVFEYPADRPRLKILVAVLFLLDTATTIVDAMIAWHYTVFARSNLILLTKLFSTASVEYALAAPTVFLVQCYYIYTIWKLLPPRLYKVPLTVIMIVFAVLSCVLGFVNVANSIRHPGFPDVFIVPKVPAILQTSTASIADVLTTATLTWVLNNNKTGFRGTDTLVRKLTVYAVNRGVLTTVVQTMQMIVYVSFAKNSLYWTILHLPGSKIYVNSFLAVLNARHYIGENGQRYLSNGFSMAEIPVDRISPGGRQKFRLSRRSQPTQSRSYVSDGLMYADSVDGDNIGIAL